MRRYARKLMERADDNTLAPITQRRTLWSSHVAMFPLFSVAAVKLLSVHVTSAAAERNWSAWGRIYTNIRNRLGIDTARKMVYIKANFDDDSEDENDRDLEVTLEYWVHVEHGRMAHARSAHAGLETAIGVIDSFCLITALNVETNSSQFVI